MAQFRVNSQRQDPYKNFKFRLKWSGRYVAGFSKLRAPKSATSKAETGVQRKSPGRSKYDAITLERGVTYDANFQSWAKSSSPQKQDGKPKSPRNLSIDVFDKAGKKLTLHKIFNAYVSRFRSSHNVPAKNVNIVSMVIRRQAMTPARVLPSRKKSS